jgi:arylsulfatase A-like enzyme
MTGQYNFRNYIGFGVLGPGERTFGHMMQVAGFATCVVGKWQLWGANDVPADPLERHSLMPDTEGPEATEARQRLQQVLDGFP